jgi:septum formation protein
MQTINSTTEGIVESPVFPLILASASPYRKILLERLGLPFTVVAAAIDETRQAGELPGQLVMRLSHAKAEKVSRSQPDSVVIGSDQLAVFNDSVVGKPGTTERAMAQLRRFSGHEIVFLTAISVQCAISGFSATEVVPTSVSFRELNEEEIERYVCIEQPLDCAGGFKAESLGISLFERLGSDDPTALIGLPLIATARLLRSAGFCLP